MKTSRIRRPRLIPAAIWFALALSCGASCIAAGDSDAPHAAVKFRDLDLSSPQGAATLYGRIVAAANEVCQSDDIDKRGLADPTRQYECIRTTIAAAVMKVGRPQLLAIYRARTHQPVPIRVAAVPPR